jgi:hypothetical protein
VALLRTGLAAAGFGVGAAFAEFPKRKELLKLRARVGWGPNAGWGVTTRDSGKGDFEFDPKGIVSAGVRLEVLCDNVGWPLGTRTEADRVLLIPLKLTVLGDIWLALGRTWLKTVTVCTVGMAGC